MIKIDVAKCTGCRMCETSCTFYHSGAIDRNRSRIKVVQQFNTGIDAPVLCRQCSEHYCLACPQQALQIGKLGQVIFSPTLCNSCGSCEKLCPIGAIEIFQGLVVVCDLCGGRPKCVESCNTGAIEYSPGEYESVSLQPFQGPSKNLNPGEKRNRYVTEMAKPVRAEWSKRHE